MTRRFVFPALISAGLLWGTTVPLSKLALPWLPPTSLAFIRFALAAAILAVVSRGRLRAAARPAILVSGALGYGGSVLLQNFGIERTSVTHAALLIGATPVLVAIIAAVCRHSLARPAAWAGFGLSLGGVAVIASGHGGGASLGGDALVLAGQLASAAFTVAQARLLPGRDPVAVTAVQLLAAAVATVPLVLLGGGLQPGQFSLTAVLATAGLVLAGTVAPTAMFAFGQSRVSADVAGAFLNLEPLVGAVMGMVVFGDPAGLRQLAGGTVILAGIGLSSLQVVREERWRQPSPAAAGQPVLAPAAARAAAAEPAGRGRAAAPAVARDTATWQTAAGRVVPVPIESGRTGQRRAQSERRAHAGQRGHPVRPAHPAGPAQPRPARGSHPHPPARPAHPVPSGRPGRVAR